MGTLRFFLALVLLAAGCALLIAANTPRDQLTAQVLVGRHSLPPASTRSISRFSSAETAARAQVSISSFVIGLSFGR